MFFRSSGHRALVPAITLLAAVPAAVVLPMPATAQSSDVLISDDGPNAGTLMLRGQRTAHAKPAVRLGTDMEVTVTGPVSRVRVTQAFRNTSTSWVEATYLYPLPPDGAVDSLKMVVGQRVIVGHIEKREAARARYEAAKARGQKAGLVEQLRPNMFTTSVANVGPGETVLISIEYQAPIVQANGTFSLRLPLVVGPRYVPPHILNAPAALADADAVTSAPVFDPKIGRGLNPTSITVHLAPGFAPANIVSRYHRVIVSGSDRDRTVRLAGSEVPADRDFQLAWRAVTATPTVGLFRERAGAGDYVMAAITPPSDRSALPSPPREMVFVIDNSGSMGGASIEEAKASLLNALGTLRPQDHFNIIRFDDTMTQLFSHSVAATPDQIERATRFAQGLQAGGGTEMLPALKAALADAASIGAASTLRQVIFLTDGEISNEQEMLATLARDAGRSHVFLVGIGSAPNEYLMSRMALFGRGAYTHVGAPEEVAAKMMPLLEILRHPAVQNLAVKLEDGALDLTPRLLPDIYAGEPLVLVGRTDRLAGRMTVTGLVGGRPWQESIDLAAAEPSPAVAKLWARRRIDDVEADRTLGKIQDGEADAQITAIGLETSLVTSQTSLVAVDETPARPPGERLVREDLPINLPAGWDFDALFGGASGGAAARDAGAFAAQAARLSLPLALPQTATDFVRLVAQGLAMLLTGLIGLIFARRRGTARWVQ